MEFLVLVAIILVVLIAVVASAIKSLIIICPPNRVAVISGRSRAVADGRDVGYRVLKGGRTIRIPVLEQVDYMDLNTIAIDVSVNNAYSKGAIPLDVQGVANIKVSSREGVLENSVERFLGRDSQYIQQIAKENLEANLRGVLSTLTPEEVNEDRLKFAQVLIDEADEDIRKLGLELDVLKIQNVTDQVGYLEAVGRRKTAQVLTEARESEAQQAADAEEAEALGRQRAELARVHSDLAIAEEKNKLRVRQAELDATAIASEKEAVVAGEKARVTAEQALEQERIELQRRRLEADVIEPARAALQAAELRAKGDASSIIADGAAQVDVLNMMTTMYKAAGADAQNIFLLNLLPELVDMITSTVADIDIDKITVIDQGGGSGGSGSGGGIPGLAAQMPAAVLSITEQIETATGVNILSALDRRKAAPSQAPNDSADSGDGGERPALQAAPEPIVAEAPRSDGSGTAPGQGGDDDDTAGGTDSADGSVTMFGSESKGDGQDSTAAFTSDISEASDLPQSSYDPDMPPPPSPAQRPSSMQPPPPNG